MAKSKFSLTSGLAHIIITGEPVFINSFYEADGTMRANVIRPRVGSEGVVYEQADFPTAQLETPLARAKRDIEFQNDVHELQAKYEEKRYGLSQAQSKALQSLSKQKNLFDRPIPLEN